MNFRNKRLQRRKIGVGEFRKKRFQKGGKTEIKEFKKNAGWKGRIRKVGELENGWELGSRNLGRIGKWKKQFRKVKNIERKEIRKADLGNEKNRKEGIQKEGKQKVQRTI